MNAEKQSADTAPHLKSLLRSSFPPLNPNGQPLSMILRGASAELGDMRLALSTNPTARDHLLVQLAYTEKTAKNEESDDDEFADDDDEDDTKEISETLESGHETISKDISGENNAARIQPTKRIRDGTDDGSNGDDDDNEDDSELLLLYVPSIRCTCASWSMEDVSGELFITSLRVLFLAEHVNDQEEPRNDVAIAGRCIALHAVDSLPSSDADGHGELGSSHHIYCQLAEPMKDDGDMGYTPAMSVFSPSEIVDEENGNLNSDEDNGEFRDDEGCFENTSTIEVYFKPATNDGESDKHGSQSNTCQIIFDALTKLASLNPEEDSDDLCNSGGGGGGGGLLSMLSLMAGIGNESRGFNIGMAMAHDDDDDDDDMVFRLGGSNNIVVDDDDSVGATNEDRQAMLRRLDGMLVVPPEYEIASTSDGQFDDAEEDDDDEIL